MTSEKIKVWRWRCKCTRCSTEWVSNTDTKPVSCPKCRSPYWDAEYQRKQPTWNKPRRTKKEEK